MRIGEMLRGPLALLVLMLLQSCNKPAAPAKTETAARPPTAGVEPQAGDTAEAETGASTPFVTAELFFELNATRNDLGLQLLLDADGWKRVGVLDPRQEEMVQLLAGGKLSRLGVTELRFESAEPTPEEVLTLFPPGKYQFSGRTVEGKSLASTATLSHTFLPAPTLSPSKREVVDPGQTVVRWNAPGAEQVEIIIENEELGDVLDVRLAGATRSLGVPPQFLRRGKQYRIEILAISENGNRTLAEGTFRTRP